MSINIFRILIKVAELVGTINCANMHSENFMLVDGTTADGREFHVSLSIQKNKEEEKDGN